MTLRSDEAASGENPSGLLERDPASPWLSRWPEWPICLVIVLVRIPFLLVHPMQEDAYITLRAARHLAEYGDFSFNLHRHFPGATSLLYPVIVAAIDLAARSHVILGLQIFGTLCIAAAGYLLARALCDRPREQSVVWLLTACWPTALLMSYTGMETALLALVLSAVLFALGRGEHPRVFAICMLLLPLVRPDAVAYGILFCIAMYLVHRRTAAWGTAALGLGCGLLLLGTRITTGHFLPTTAQAKEIAYHPSHGAAAIAERIYQIFVRRSFLLPTPTNYLLRLSPLMFALAIAAFAFAFLHASSRRDRILLAALAAATILVPAAYAVGGVIFAWYLYPANWLAAAVVIAVAVRLLLHGRLRIPAVLVFSVVWAGLLALQWSKAFTAATEDYHYRGDIGRYLASVSHGQGTLFLEPAGLIPYYSGLRTDDEVGLVSDRVTASMERDPVGWWFDYVQAARPDYIVQRQSFSHYETFEGYTLSPAQQQWFARHYVLLRRFHYTPASYHTSPLLLRILAMGPLEDYLVYARRDAQAADTAQP